jgi:PIN domain nuclease of toxin-antitoxin system
MRLLLDSHAFLWWLGDESKLKREAMSAIADPSSVVNVSAATIWELSIKSSLRKLDLGTVDLVAEIDGYDFVVLPIAARHSSVAASLPRHHDDPFDRMLIAQALYEGLTIVTRDPAFSSYGVPILST